MGAIAPRILVFALVALTSFVLHLVSILTLSQHQHNTRMHTLSQAVSSQVAADAAYPMAQGDLVSLSVLKNRLEEEYGFDYVGFWSNNQTPILPQGTLPQEVLEDAYTHTLIHDNAATGVLALYVAPMSILTRIQETWMLIGASFVLHLLLLLSYPWINALKSREEVSAQTPSKQGALEGNASSNQGVHCPPQTDDNAPVRTDKMNAQATPLEWVLIQSKSRAQTDEHITFEALLADENSVYLHILPQNKDGVLDLLSVGMSERLRAFQKSLIDKAVAVVNASFGIQIQMVKESPFLLKIDGKNAHHAYKGALILGAAIQEAFETAKTQMARIKDDKLALVVPSVKAGIAPAPNMRYLKKIESSNKADVFCAADAKNLSALKKGVHLSPILGMPGAKMTWQRLGGFIGAWQDAYDDVFKALMTPNTSAQNKD